MVDRVIPLDRVIQDLLDGLHIAKRMPLWEQEALKLEWSVLDAHDRLVAACAAARVKGPWETLEPAEIGDLNEAKQQCEAFFHRMIDDGDDIAHSHRLSRRTILSIKRAEGCLRQWWRTWRTWRVRLRSHGQGTSDTTAAN